MPDRVVASAALAVALVLVVVPVVTGEQPAQLLPVPNEEFREILLETPRPPPIEVFPIPETRQKDPQRHEHPHPVSQPAPQFVSQPKPAAKPTGARGRVTGVATWYCEPGVSVCTHGYPAGGNYGAAGPELRAALGPHYKGHTVYVNGVPVILVDFCACGGDHVIDVYHSTWLKIPHPNHAVITWR